MVMDDYYYESKIMEQLNDEDTYVQVGKNNDANLLHHLSKQDLGCIYLLTLNVRNNKTTD